MKKIAVFLLSALLFSLCIIQTSAASISNIVSPALQVLSYDFSMVKSGLIAGKITFTEDDFENAVGCRLDSVTITSLPSASDGILTYNGAAVTVNQTISAKGLSSLSYVPNNASECTSFRFKTSGEYSMECYIKYTDSINLAPSVVMSGAVPVWTQTDITTYGKLNGSDPENDAVEFEITRYPEKGILKLTDKVLGNYTYTPCSGISGKDSFTYCVVDEWGNRSDECTVVVEIDKAVCEIVFADMDEHWAHNAAIVMASENAMKYDMSDGIAYFYPEKEMTREEFLVSAMKILGAGEIPPQTTVFADDGDISENASGYIARAYSLGLINGTETDGLLCFEPTSVITRAQAAVILNKIIGAEEAEILPAFADSDSVPAWAKGSLNALVNEGILNGTDGGNISANESLSRAQAAQLLLKVKQIYN